MTNLWKASGENRTKAPNFWINQDDTKQFIKTVVQQLNATEDCILQTTKGRTGGTNGHWQIALAYAITL